MHYIEKADGKFIAKKAVKLKGVGRKYRTIELAETLYTKTMDYFSGATEEVPFVLTNVMESWKRPGAGAMIS